MEAPRSVLTSFQVITIPLRKSAEVRSSFRIPYSVFAIHFLACTVLAAASPERPGTIAGVVLNASQGQAPAGRCPVVLLASIDGQLAPVRETTADSQGGFAFRGLPVATGVEYLPGANWGGVHHPGPRCRLTADQPRAAVELSVYDSVEEPTPLVIRRQEVVIRPGPGALHVTESLLIDNPSLLCYVGRNTDGGSEPVTLQLAIPADFERATFEQEFYGRRFSLADGKLVTGIPWPPGRRELRLTYTLPNRRRHSCWLRPLDLPCDHVRVRIQTARPEAVSCNLQRAPADSSGEVVFESAGRSLSPGETIRVELGRLPLPLMAYARWGALVVLSMLVAAASLVILRRRRDRAGAKGPLGPAQKGRPPRRDTKRSDRTTMSSMQK